jgi:hypothetical protein
MPIHARKHLTAWLGLVAMWLVVLAPLVSQLVVADLRSDPAEGVLCSAGQPASGPTLQDHADRLAACGYCDLLSSHGAMPPVQPGALAFVALVALPAVLPLASRYVPFGAFASGRPRAPPAGIHPGL